MRYAKHKVDDKGWTPWIVPIHTESNVTHRIACCDCGLVHDLEFNLDILKNKIRFRARRNARATSAKRRAAEEGRDAK